MVLGSEATNGAVSVVQGSALHRLFMFVAKVAHRAPVDLRRGCHSSSIDEASRRRKFALRLPHFSISCVALAPGRHHVSATVTVQRASLRLKDANFAEN